MYVELGFKLIIFTLMPLLVIGNNEFNCLVNFLTVMINYEVHQCSKYINAMTEMKILEQNTKLTKLFS
jgi:hypothetical protein